MDLVSNDIPFAYRERQLQAIFAPVLNDISDGCFKVELFVSRNDKKPRHIDKELHGWVDYWCGYRNTDIFIELKHGFVNEQTGRVRKEVQSKWTEALNQISTIKKDVKDYSIIGTNDPLRIALIILPIYKTIKDGEVEKYASNEMLTKIQIDVMKYLTPSPTCSGLWILHEDLENRMEYIKSTESYSGVLFMAYVE